MKEIKVYQVKEKMPLDNEKALLLIGSRGGRSGKFIYPYRSLPRMYREDYLIFRFYGTDKPIEVNNNWYYCSREEEKRLFGMNSER